MVDHNPKLVADSHYYVPEALQAILTASGLAGDAGGFGYRFARKVVAFTGGAGLGAVGVVPLFTVTGGVAFRIVAICTESLVCGAGATLSIGTPGTVAGVIAVTGATDIDAGDIWFAAAPATVLDTLANAMKEYVIGDGADIQGNVLVDAISDGTIEFAVWWTPITANGAVTVA
jgi:hypothetical protein